MVGPLWLPASSEAGGAAFHGGNDGNSDDDGGCLCLGFIYTCVYGFVFTSSGAMLNHKIDTELRENPSTGRKTTIYFLINFSY